jgi:ABC-type nitrate/sulfonate/bicarbonate transport system substrate-binding protein
MTWERLSIFMEKETSTLTTRTLLLIGLLASVFPFTHAEAQLTKLNVAYTGESPTQLAAFLAKETGIFAKNGLDVQVIRTTSSVAVMGLIAGELSILQVAAPTVITSALRGSDAVYVAAGVVTLDYWLMSGKAIKTGAQLKNGILGSSDLSGASFIASRFAVRKLGLDPDKDVAIIRSGGTPERLVGLRAGRIQATLLSPPTSFIAQKEGFNFLTDVAGLPFQHNGVVTTRKFIREHPDTVRRYVKSQIEAVHLMKTDRETGLKVLGKFLARQKDRDLIEKSYDVSMGEEVYPRKQYPTLPGIATVLEAMVKENPKAREAKPEDFVDLRFVKELDESGFIDSLYKKKPAKQ